MHRFLFALLALLSTASVVRSQGIAARSTAESLRGLHGVHVVVEELNPAVRQAGLTSTGIKSAVEDRLVKKGVPVLGLGELTMDPRGPTLLIKLDFVAADPVYFYNSEVQFFQNVTVDVGEGELPSYASASTWQTSRVDKAGKFRLPTLPSEVVGQVDQFIDAYLSMNAAMAPPAPEPQTADVEEETPNEKQEQ
ncbi:MAG: hypothetical protein WBW88_07545 [Rhodothermales bacterium]|jgi:hypothetical protein